MKNIWLILTLIVLCGCSADNDFYNTMDENVVTRSTDGTTNYNLDFYFSSGTTRYEHMGGTKEITILSYMETDGVVTDIEPEIISKPAWVDSIGCMHVYYKIYVFFVKVSENNTNNERTGTLLLGQPNSSKRLSIPLLQEQRDNVIHIGVATLYANHYEFRATTTYPVKEDLEIRIPFDVYNDGGKYEKENARIIISKNQNYGSSIMDYNSSPLVHYHGDIKGFKLYEGTIYSATNDIYNYRFSPY